MTVWMHLRQATLEPKKACPPSWTLGCKYPLRVPHKQQQVWTTWRQTCKWCKNRLNVARASECTMSVCFWQESEHPNISEQAESKSQHLVDLALVALAFFPASSVSLQWQQKTETEQFLVSDSFCIQLERSIKTHNSKKPTGRIWISNAKELPDFLKPAPSPLWAPWADKNWYAVHACARLFSWVLILDVKMIVYFCICLLFQSFKPRNARPKGGLRKSHLAVP